MKSKIDEYLTAQREMGPIDGGAMEVALAGKQCMKNITIADLTTPTDKNSLRLHPGGLNDPTGESHAAFAIKNCGERKSWPRCLISISATLKNFCDRMNHVRKR